MRTLSDDRAERARSTLSLQTCARRERVPSIALASNVWILLWTFFVRDFFKLKS